MHFVIPPIETRSIEKIFKFTFIKTGDTEMKISTVLMTSFAALTIGVANADDNLYQSLDANQDQQLSKEEASIMPGVIKVWDQLDVDKNDQLSAEEFSKYEEIKLLSQTTPKG